MGIPMKQPYTMENPPADDLAGLRNEVRYICRAAASRDANEARLLADGLLDDLLSSGVAFSWSGGTPAQARMNRHAAAVAMQAKEDQQRGIAAFAAANPAMVD